MLMVSVLIVMESGWPPLFTQTRVGGDGRQFKLYKFRTMVVNAEKMGAGLYFEENDTRFTQVGKFLRRYSLDELPQLWNVLIGDESLVGPRAMVPFTAEKLSPQQSLRHRVRPGITGWAQINGRDAIPWSKRIELDNWYIDNWSLWLDLRIIVQTIPAMVTPDLTHDQPFRPDIDDLG
jgi:lipopolysaccharide/colanic/teichoic acid biosynthesis glycosyltransferase